MGPRQLGCGECALRMRGGGARRYSVFRGGFFRLGPWSLPGFPPLPHTPRKPRVSRRKALVPLIPNHKRFFRGFLEGDDPNTPPGSA